MILEAVTLAQILKPKEPLPQPKPVQTAQVVPKQETKKPKPKPITYKVKSGDTLNSISKAHRVPVSRLWSANRQLHNPDIIRVGERLRIPRPDDKLKKRAMIKVAVNRDTIKSAAPTLQKLGGFSSSGNSYEPGQCTWHVKNLAPWVESWGDASSWSYNASKDGYATHSTPEAGAVAWRSGHVAYVIKVTNAGVLVSEMNYDYVPFHQREIVVPVSSYQYIY